MPPLTAEDRQTLKPVCEPRALSSLNASYTPGPRAKGTIDLIVLRPARNERVVVTEAAATIAQGVVGSGWVEKPQRGLLDQVCVMSSSAIRTIAGEDPGLWPPAGDQLFVDMDLAKGVLEAGDRVAVGNADDGVVLEVTKKPHTGCAKFSLRYGEDALKFVNMPESKAKRMRGIYFSVVKEGTIRVGDAVVKI